MELNQSLIGYASAFSSFLLDSNIGSHINKIILFGSTARGEATKESDIDIFVDISEEHESEVQAILKLFNLSQTNKQWRLKGITQEISLKIGQLKKWRSRREILSSGITLYGKFNELPEKAEFYALIELEEINSRDIAQQVKFWRKLYGYKQKVGKNVYIKKGLVELSLGRKMGKGVILVPMKNRKEILNYLNQQKMKHKIYEIWSDEF
ncbi:nucleotidyltransferase domain-containing protein [Candidatus Woesearchaeota archaeon]|nr:nucleotidyltransferase domain-containing protein [Candidatus Woesearchaeota archaeon]